MNPAIRRIAFLASITASLLAGSWPESLSAQSASFEDGLAAYKAGRDQDAVRIWMPLAEGGDPLAQYSLGKLYETGHGGTPDFETAARWYALAAQQDMPAAQNNLGLMYAQGRGVPRDPVRAAQLWSRSADASNPMAQYNLGLAYFRGDGVGQDQVEAAVWFHLAADAGVGEAQFALGQMHRLGLALPQDDRRALHWYQRAAKKGHQDAQVQAARLQALGVQASQPLDVIPSDPLEQAESDRQIAEADAATETSNRQPSLVQDTAGQRAGQKSAPTAPASAASNARPAEQSDQGGFQLQSRLITPAEPPKATGGKKGATSAAPTPKVDPAPEKAAVNKASKAEPSQTARASATASSGAPAVSEKTGTFLWLLSSADEAQAHDLLKEAEKDYADALEGRNFSLQRDSAPGARAFYRLVVAAKSEAEATATCEKIRKIKAEAFCSILVR